MEVGVRFTHSCVASRCRSSLWLTLKHVWRTVVYPHGHGAVPARVAGYFRALRERLPVMLPSGHIDLCDGEGRGGEEEWAPGRCKILIISSDGARAISRDAWAPRCARVARRGGTEDDGGGGGRVAQGGAKVFCWNNHTA